METDGFTQSQKLDCEREMKKTAILSISRVNRDSHAMTNFSIASAMKALFVVNL